MKYIEGVVFSNTYNAGYSNDAAKTSLIEMQKQTACNTVVFIISAMQSRASDSVIDYRHVFMPKDQNIIELIEFAKSIGLQTILKPEILCMDGSSQSEIAYYHQGEKEDSFWFQEYTAYIMHYAQLAAKVDCDMLMIGCELVELEKKEFYWRNLICQVRKVYPGFLTYNAKRCEDANVLWWDALDYISANGFYPRTELKDKIHRINEIQKKYNKPFFFSQVGCKSCEGSAEDPEDWRLQGNINLNQQAQYFQDFISECSQSENLSGMVVYHWWKDQKGQKDVSKDSSYNIVGKPACEVIRNGWNEKEER